MSSPQAIALNLLEQGLWYRVRAVRFPRQGLAALAPFRADSTLRFHSGPIWNSLTFTGPKVHLLSQLLGVPEFEFCYPHQGNWFRIGSKLPIEAIPDHESGQLLSQVIFPDRFTPRPIPSLDLQARVKMQLIAGGEPQIATLLQCQLSDLAAWAETATTHQIQSMHGVQAGPDALIWGRQLPTIAGGTRFWGEAIFLPLGYRLEPNLPHESLRQLYLLDADEWLLIQPTHATRILKTQFEPLTRSGIRIALRDWLESREPA